MSNKEKGAIFLVLGLILIDTSHLVDLSNVTHLIRYIYSMGLIIYGGIIFSKKKD